MVRRVIAVPQAPLVQPDLLVLRVAVLLAPLGRAARLVPPAPLVPKALLARPVAAAAALKS
jgi:hypothetical protein